jgi:N-methylhydantoinase A
LLRMGPQSASSSPGPACYGRGGTRPTCTDANLILGYLDPASFLGGRMPLDRAAAENAIFDHVAKPLGITIEEAAMSMFEVINANMATGIRDMVVDRGFDPRQLPLIIGGGAGPLHAGALAEELEIPLVVIPRESPVLCASGMLFSDIKHDLVRSHYVPVPQLIPEQWALLFREMEIEGRKRLAVEGVGASKVDIRFAADLRYSRQLHEITVPLSRGEVERSSAEELHMIFDREHDRLFGYSLTDHPLDLVNVRVSCVGILPKPKVGHLKMTNATNAESRKFRRAYVPLKNAFEVIPLHIGDDLKEGDIVRGPSIVELPQTSIVVPAGFDLHCDTDGSLLLRRSP